MASKCFLKSSLHHTLHHTLHHAPMQRATGQQFQLLPVRARPAQFTRQQNSDQNQTFTPTPQTRNRNERVSTGKRNFALRCFHASTRERIPARTHPRATDKLTGSAALPQQASAKQPCRPSAFLCRQHGSRRSRQASAESEENRTLSPSNRNMRVSKGMRNAAIRRSLASTHLRILARTRPRTANHAPAAAGHERAHFRQLAACPRRCDGATAASVSEANCRPAPWLARRRLPLRSALHYGALAS